MSAIELTITPNQTSGELSFQYLHIRITASTGIIQPSDLKDLKVPDGMNWRHGVVIEGKAPIWLYGYLIHECHPSAWVACFDPRLGGVVISTHSPAIAVGTILDLQPTTLN